MSNHFLQVSEIVKQFDKLTVPHSSGTPRPFSRQRRDQDESVTLYGNGHRRSVWKVSVDGEFVNPFCQLLTEIRLLFI